MRIPVRPSVTWLRVICNIISSDMKAQTNTIANPLSELAIQSTKYAGNCLRLYLGKKNISSLGKDFEKFTALESLWLNDNKLRSINGLQKNITLKYLYLHGNQLSTLGCHESEGTFYNRAILHDSIIINLKFLKELTLNDNKIHNLQEIITQLKYLPYISVLTLYNNPCEQEDNYRLLLIGNLPQLEILDRSKITPLERKHAKMLIDKMNRLESLVMIHKDNSCDNNDNNETIATKPLTNKEIEQQNQRNDEIHRNMIDKLRSKIKPKRIFLYHLFSEHDKRRLNIIPTDLFWNILNDHGLTDILTSEEYDIITKLYQIEQYVEGISPSGVVKIKGIRYDRLCMQLESGRNIHHHQELSSTTQDLEKYVESIKRFQKSIDDATVSKPIFETTDFSSINNNNAYAAVKLRTIPFKAIENGLDPWMSYEISKILKKYEDENKFSLSYDDIENIFHQINSFGFIPIDGNENTINLLFQSFIASSPSDDSKGISPRLKTIDLDFVREAFGCVLSTYEVPIPERSLGSKKGSGNINRKKSLPHSLSRMKSSSKPPVIVFRELNDFEKKNIERVKGDCSNQLLESLLRETNDQQMKVLSRQVMSTALESIRMKSLQNDTANHNNELSSPSTIIKSSGMRSDILIIPNLRSKQFTTSDFNENEWKTHFQKLGLADQALNSALARKRRTNILRKRELDEQEMRSESIRSAVGQARELAADTVRSSTAFTMKTKSSIQPVFSWDMKWNPETTGTVVLSNSFSNRKKKLQ